MISDLRHGRWEDVLADFGGPIECDALITDPPYSARTHDQEEGTRYDGYTVEGMAPLYPPWSPRDVDTFVDAWSPRVRGWIACLCDHPLVPAYEAAYQRNDRFAFAPIPCVIRGMSVRRSCDGPSSWTVWLMVGRPRRKEFMTWGTLDGAYVGPRWAGAGGGRGKPPWLASAIVRDYSRKGDLVVDPLAGWGSTLAAAESLGRRAIGAEMDLAAIEEGRRRLSQNQPDMFA